LANNCCYLAKFNPHKN